MNVKIIIGAGSGIGRASAVLLAKEGAKVYITDVSEEGLQGTKDLIISETMQSSNVKILKLDVSNEQDVANAIKDCVSTFGKIDVCFANAGISEAVTFLETDEEDALRVLKINVLGVLYCFKHAAKTMIEKKQPGSLIATASVAGIRSGAGGSIYSASKAAVISLVQTAANQLTGTNIRCNAIAPGLIETGMTKIVFDIADQKGIRKKIGQLNPMWRYGEPIEIAKPVLFLASDDSSYVTGTVIPVDGGLSSSREFHSFLRTHFLNCFLFCFAKIIVILHNKSIDPVTKRGPGLLAV